MMSILFKRNFNSTTQDTIKNNNTSNFTVINNNSSDTLFSDTYPNSKNTTLMSGLFFEEETSETSKHLAIVGVFLAAGVSILLLLLIAYLYKRKRVKKIKPRSIFNPKYSQPLQKEEIIDFTLITQRLPHLPQKHKLHTKNNGNKAETVTADQKSNDSGNNSSLTLSRASRGSVSCGSHGNSLLVECEVHEADSEASPDGCYNNLGFNKRKNIRENKNNDVENKNNKTRKGQPLTTKEKLDKTYDKLQELQEQHRIQQLRWQQKFTTLQLKRQQKMLQKRTTLFPPMYNSLTPSQDDESQFKELLNKKNNKLNNNNNNNNDKNNDADNKSNKPDNKKNKSNNEIDNLKINKIGDDSDDDAYEKELGSKLLQVGGSLDSYDRTFNPFFKEDDDEVWDL